MVVLSDQNSIEVGHRIVCEEYYGTVRYKGQVLPTKGEWLGVEWDDVTRGKHNGTHDGVTYFTTSHSSSGSFLRPHKASRGISFMSALENRYGQLDDESAGMLEEDMYVVGSNQQHTVVEMVGVKKVNKKQSQLDHLNEVAFRGVPMYGLDNEVDLGNILKSVCELDLSMTLLSSWQDVARITKTLKTLKSLNVSVNPLTFPNDMDLSNCFSSVKSLRINRTGYTWSQVLQCTAMFPALEELNCCFNKIDCIDKTDGVVEQLKLLNLEANPLCDWRDVMKFSHLPQLEFLLLNDTKLKSIRFEETDSTGKTSKFPKLKILYISNSQITGWESIDELDKLESLTELHIKKNPVTEATPNMTVETIRSLTIAKISSLKVLNRSEILPGERLGAEYDYLKMFGKEWKEAGGHQDPAKNQPNQQFCQRHPVFQKLIIKYGAPEDSLFKVHSSALKNNLITVLIRSPNVPEKAAISKKLPLTMAVYRLKSMLQRLFKADPVTMKITYISQKMVGQEFELDSGQREIGYFSIEDGDTVLVTW